MVTTGSRTEVFGQTEVEDTQVRRKGRFLFFKTEWWETVSTEVVGNDIHIITNRPIQRVFLNGNETRPIDAR